MSDLLQSPGSPGMLHRSKNRHAVATAFVEQRSYSRVPRPSDGTVTSQHASFVKILLCAGRRLDYTLMVGIHAFIDDLAMEFSDRRMRIVGACCRLKFGPARSTP